MSGAPRTAGRASLGPGVVPPAPSTSNKLLSRAESNWGKVRDVAKTNVKDSGTSVRVVCRVRPMNRKELDMKTTPCVVAKGGTSVVVSEGDANFSDKRRFNFDKVYGSESKQGEVFDFCGKPVVLDVLKGYNGTIFAYGQTGSGKTFTMEGPDVENPETQGMIPRCIDTIFEAIEEADPSLTFTISVSYIEIYLEKIRDLLDPRKDNLKIKKKDTVYIDGATETYISSVDEIMDALHLGATNRATSSTHMNAQSSRSHSVFIVTITQKNEKNGTVIKGKLYLVDLAGSEKIRKTGASGTRLDEAKMINTSLSALGLVIKKLTEEKSTHIPYRDSKLTRLLEESLGGNAKTTLVVCCSPSTFNHDETVSTLRFGERAKKVKNKAKVNQERTSEELMRLLRQAQKAILLLEKRIHVLEKELETYRDGPKPARKKGGDRRQTTGSITPLGTIEDVDGGTSSDEESSSEDAGAPGIAASPEALEKLAAAEAALSELKDEALALKEQLEHYQLKTSELQLQNANMVGEIQALRENVKEGEEKVIIEAEKSRVAIKQSDGLKAHVSALEREKKELQSQFESNRKGNLAMLEATTELEEKLTSAKVELEDREDQLKELESKQREGQVKRDELEKQVREAESKIGHNETLITKLLNEGQEHENSKSALENRLEEASVAKQSLEKNQESERFKYVEELTKLKSELEEKREREKELRDEVERTKNFEEKCNELGRKLEFAERKHESRLSTMQSKHTKSIQEIALRAARAESSIAQLEEKLKGAESDATKKGEEIASLKQAERALQEAHEDAVKEISSKTLLQKQKFEELLQTEKEERRNVAKQAEEKGADLMKLKNAMSERDSRIQALSTELEQSNQTKVTMQVEHTTEKLQLTQEKDALSETAKGLGRKISGLEEKVNEGEVVKAKAKELEESLNALKQTHKSQMEKQDAESKQSIAEVGQKLEVSKANYLLLQEQLKQKTVEGDETAKQLAELRSSSTSKMNEHTKRIEGLERHVSAEQATIEELKQELKGQIDDAAAKQQEIDSKLQLSLEEGSKLAKTHEAASEQAKNAIAKLEQKCEGYAKNISDVEQKMHEQTVKHKERSLKMQDEHKTDLEAIKKSHSQELKSKNDEINAQFRSQNEQNSEHAKAVDALNSSLRTAEAELVRSQAAEENLRIAMSEQKEAVQTELMGRLENAQRDVQLAQEECGTVKAQRDRAQGDLAKSQHSLAVLQGAQKALVEQMKELQGVKEALQTSNEKVQVLETRLEEKVGEAKMEKDRAVRAEEMLKTEKNDFQIQLQSRAESAKEELDLERKQGKENIAKLENKIVQLNTQFDNAKALHAIDIKELKESLAAKGKEHIDLVKTSKSDAAALQEKLEAERASANERTDTLRASVQSLETKISELVLKHSEDRNSWAMTSKIEQSYAIEEEEKKRSEEVRRLKEEHATNLATVREKLNVQKQEALNTCMQTTMGEMQKALKEASQDKEEAVLKVRNEWKDKNAEIVLKHSEEVQQLKGDFAEKEAGLEKEISVQKAELTAFGQKVLELETNVSSSLRDHEKAAENLEAKMASEREESRRKLSSLEENLQQAEIRFGEQASKHAEERERWSAQSAADLEKSVEDEAAKREKCISDMREEKSRALLELREQLSAEKQRAINTCMETTMEEMQKALRKAAAQKEEALEKVRLEWRSNLAEQARVSKAELERRIALCSEETGKEIANVRGEAADELKRRLEQQGEELRLERERDAFEIEARHEAEMEVQEREIREQLTDEFKLQQTSSSNQTKQMLFKLGHADASRRTQERASAQKKKKKFSWLPFGRQKESLESLDSPGYRAHASSVSGAVNVVIGGESNPFADPDLPDKYAASCETVAALMVQVQEHAETTMKKTEENENLKGEVDALRKQEALMQNTINAYNAKMSKLILANDDDETERMNKLTKLESSCQELQSLVRTANKENQQLKMDLELLGIKGARKDQQIYDLEEALKAKSAESRQLTRGDSKQRLVRPLRGGGGTSIDNSSPKSLSGGGGRTRRRSYSGHGMAASPLERTRSDGDVISAGGSSTPFASEMMSPAVETPSATRLFNEQRGDGDDNYSPGI
jgi:kinesin family member 5